MADNNDIIDVMFKTVIEAAGWIFKKIFQFVWWVISSIFKFLWQLITKNKNSSQSPNVSNDAVGQLYVDTKNYVNELDTGTLALKTDEIVNWFATKIITNTVLSVNNKCELLSMLNDKLQEADPSYYNMVFCLIIEYAYKIIEGIVPSSLLLQKYGTFKQEMLQNNVKDFAAYFGELFSASGLLGSPNGKFSLDYSLFNNYNFPQYRKI
jgi:hypothetical protein